jgi:hypothetical protein
MPWKIGLIGTGNVASFWAHNLKGIVSAELFVRGSSPEKTGSFVTTHGLIELDAQAVDVFLICVQDRNIASAITALPEHTPAFICAGLFSIHPYLTRPIGIIYPLQTIQAQALPSFSTVPFLAEFSESVRDIGSSFLYEMGLKYSEETEEARFSAHLAAVFINNFGYFLMKHGLSLAQAHNIPSSLFKPLINQTISNLLLDKDLQTGPARRNDIETLRSHESMLSDQSLEIYKALSAFIQHTNSNEL